MNQTSVAAAAFSPAYTRLSWLAPLDRPAETALLTAIAQAQPFRARRDLLTDGQEISEPKLIVSGWAARVRHLADGRRQFLSFLVPGDLIGFARQSYPLATCSVVAISDMQLGTLPPPETSPMLGEAYAVSGALEEAYLLAQITRLGRFNAQERICDLFLELFERLALTGLVANGSFDLPMTQEMLGDALGLTSVHVNRMLQQARREGDLHWRAGRLTLCDPTALARKIGRSPVRVSAASQIKAGRG